MKISDELRRRSDGTYVFEGRSDLVVNRGGGEFSLEAIESHLREKLGIECLALPLPDSRLGQELGLLIAGDVPAQKISYGPSEKILLRL